MAKGSGLNKKYELSDEMADFMGKDQASRAEIMKKLWSYIKKHDLQDPDNKRNIQPDDTLATILGSRDINMFQMTKKISEHLFDE